MWTDSVPTRLNTRMTNPSTVAMNSALSGLPGRGSEANANTGARIGTTAIGAGSRLHVSRNSSFCDHVTTAGLNDSSWFHVPAISGNRNVWLERNAATHHGTRTASATAAAATQC